MRNLRRFTRALAAVACATLALAGCAGASQPKASEGQTLTVGLSYTPNVQFAPFYVADKLGYFTDAGVSVTLRHHGESEELFGALKNGTEQLVYAGGDEITQAVAGGVAMQSVATVFNTYPAVLIVPKDSAITTAADLAGHTVGVPGLYGQTYFALLALLHDAGLTENDVKIQAIGYTQQAALTGGKVDAVMGFSNNDAVQFTAAGFAIRTINAVDPASPTLVGPAIAAANSVVEARGEQVRAVLSALSRAITYVSENPEEAVDITAQYVPTLTGQQQREAALATLEATIPLMKPVGDEPLLTNRPEVWDAMAKFMHESGLIQNEVAGNTLYTNELLPTK